MIRVAPARALLISCLALQIFGCTLLVDSQIRQCQSNAECARFGNSVCDPGQLLCVAAPALPDGGADAAVITQSTADAAATCRGANGCYSCAPKTDPDFFNACTDGHCIPFDNKSRLASLAPDGTLRPLP